VTTNSTIAAMSFAESLAPWMYIDGGRTKRGWRWAVVDMRRSIVRGLNINFGERIVMISSKRNNQSRNNSTFV
jgi:hypothetical protein